jgi:prevent-host-death family protein
MRHLSVSAARAELPKLVGSGERVVITRNGQPMAVLMAVDDYRVLRATQELARDPAAVARVHRGYEQVQRGDDSDFHGFDESANRPKERPATAEWLYEAPPPSARYHNLNYDQLLNLILERIAAIEKAVRDQVEHSAQLERRQAALKEETLAEARRAAAEEARHAVAEAASR